MAAVGLVAVIASLGLAMAAALGLAFVLIGSAIDQAVR